MTRRTVVAVLSLGGPAVLAAVLMVEPLQGAKPVADVPLKATFRNLDTDSILNGLDDPYVTLKGGGVSVYFTGDNGELVFTIDHHATRPIGVIFPDLPPNATVGYLPDTDGRYGRPLEPVDFFKLRTFNSAGFAEPKVNFLTMTPGQISQVRLWTTVCTTQRHYFFMNYWMDTGKIAGVVQVTAWDEKLEDGTPGKDGVVDKWVIEPVPGTNDGANIYKQSESGKTVHYYFGNGPMAFLLTLEKR